MEQESRGVNKISRGFRTILTVLLMTVLVGFVFFGNLLFTRAEPGGTDFLYRWLPTRLILFEGYDNPYSDEAELRVELMHHGHARQGDEIPGMFDYPYYILPLMIPFALIEDFSLARALWMTMLEVIHVLLVVLTLRLFKIRLRSGLLALLLIFALWCSFFTQPLVDGNLSPVAALFTLLSLVMIAKNKDIPAGILLALSTIKPQLSVLFCILVCWWAFSHRRWQIILAAGISMALLWGVSFAIQPSWFTEFLKDVSTYPEIASPHSPASILAAWLPKTSQWIGWGFSLAVGLVLVREWIRVFGKDPTMLFWTASLTFALAPLSGISSAKSNFIAMLPGIVLLTAALAHRWRKTCLVVPVGMILIMLVSWAATLIGLIYYPEVESVTFIDFLIAPIMLAGGLFWMKKYLQKSGTAGGMDLVPLQK